MRTRVRDLIEDLKRMDLDATVQFRTTDRVFRASYSTLVGDIAVDRIEYERIRQRGGNVEIEVVCL